MGATNECGVCYRYYIWLGNRKRFTEIFEYMPGTIKIHDREKELNDVIIQSVKIFPQHPTAT